MFDSLLARIVEIEAAPAKVASIAAPRIQAKLRADSTTKRGNVPSFGPFGDTPSTATAIGESIDVRAAGWVMQIADKRGQIDEWVGVVKQIAAEVLAGEAQS